MGRLQIETPPSQYPASEVQLQLQPQPQSFTYPAAAQPNPLPQQFYHQQPSNVVNVTDDINYLQQVINNDNDVAYPPPQSHPHQASQGVILQNAHINSTFPSSGTAPSIQDHASIQQVVNDAPWTTGLFNCLEDPANAFITAFFPCITFGQIADVLDNGHTTCATGAILYVAAPCLISKPYRRKLRRRFGLMEVPPDWFVHSMFEPCGLCQMYRELKNRGLDPALGHHGNMNKNQDKQDVTTMVPPSNQTMQN